jgi:hypothetical protein
MVYFISSILVAIIAGVASVYLRRTERKVLETEIGQIQQEAQEIEIE